MCLKISRCFVKQWRRHGTSKKGTTVMWKQLLWSGAGIAVAGIAEIVRELHTFRCRTYRIVTSRLPEGEKGRIVFLSDLHNHRYGKGNEKLIEAIKNARPDVILVGGDMLVAKKGASWEATVEFMKVLPQIATVYYVDGNHEQRMKRSVDVYGSDYADYRSVLEAAGVRFLDNACAWVRIGTARVRLCGMEVPDPFYKRGKRQQMHLEDVEKVMGTPEPDGYRILMVHQPDFAPVYLEWGADLVLSGHLHGGIVRIPWIGAIISPQLQFFPKFSGGMYEVEGGKHVVVSQGLGTHTINLRLFNPAEVVVLQLEGRP